MTIYESNLKTLKEKAPDIHNILVNDTPIFDVEIEATEDKDNDIIIYDNCRCFVNSVYNINAEIANMVRNINRDTEIFIVFGLGNGRIITYLQKHFWNIKKIIVVEPSLDIFKNYLSKFYFMDLFVGGRGVGISVVVNKTKDELSIELPSIYTKDTNVALVEHISYRTVFNSYYNHMNYSIIELLRTQRYNIKTLADMYLLWERNSITNSKYQSLMVDNLFKYIEGKPAIIVSAGTSLKKNMHLLNQLKEKALLFAGGSTVRVLAKNGITPTVRASIDGQDYQNVIFQNIEDDNVPLLFRNMSNVHLVRNYQGPKFRAIIDDDNLWKYICNKKELPINILDTSPSVSNFIFEVLIAAKCDPIIFVGQDMCSYGESKYADSDDNTESLLKMKKEMEFLDIYGNKVTTEINYLQIKYAFDKQAKKCNARLINATEGGLGIEGTEVKTLESVLNEDLADELDLDFEEIVEIELLKKSYEDTHLKVQEALQEIKAESKEILEIFIEIFRTIDNFTRLKAKNYKEGRLRKEVEHIDNLYARLMEKGLYRDVAIGATASITQAFNLKYAYNGTDKMKIIDNKVAKAASNAEVIFKFIQEFQAI